MGQDGSSPRQMQGQGVIVTALPSRLSYAVIEDAGAGAARAKSDDAGRDRL